MKSKLNLILIILVIFFHSCTKQEDLILHGPNANDLESKVAPTIDYEGLSDYYFIFFGFHEGENPIYVFEQQIMIGALQQIYIPSNPTICLGCTSIDCKLQEILDNHSNISQEIKDQLNQNYVVRLYDLPQDFPVEDIEYGLLTELVDYSCSPNTIIDVCSGYLVPFEEIKNAFINISDLANPNITLNSLHEALDGWDYIHMPKRVKARCPKYYCIIDEMMNGSLGTSFICDLFSGFDGTTGNNDGAGFNLFIAALDFSSQSGLNNNAYAGTVASEGLPDDYRIQLYINTLNCEIIDAISIFETIQHELIHADIKRRLIEVYGWNTSAVTEADAFHQLVLEEYGGQAGTDEHMLMLEYYLREMVNSLIEMNGGIGAYDNFVGGVLNGFPIEVLNYCGITYFDIVQQHADFLTFINTSGNINSTLTDCN